MTIDLKDLDLLYKEVSNNNSISIDDLKKQLLPLIKELKLKQDKKNEVSNDLKNLNIEIQEIESKIRRQWHPFIVGAEKAELLFDDFSLSFAKRLNVYIDPDIDDGKDQAIQWLESNGYKDVLKYDINTNKLKSIAKANYESQESKTIPGVKYTFFDEIKIK